MSQRRAKVAAGLFDEILVDCFAGGGGASIGIEQGLGRALDEAINHDPVAVAMYAANHPNTRVHCENIWDVDPRDVTEERPVGAAWFSPDCTDFSKAKGGRPVRRRHTRMLAWNVLRWAALVRPRVSFLENVEEFAAWGPLTRKRGRPKHPQPCRFRREQNFRRWYGQLHDLGYEVEWRELRACDYGAPTIRKRLFVIARCDGLPIVWPAATHVPAGKAGELGLKPYRTAAECIDWSLPCPSIFLTKEEGRAIGVKRPLAENTLKRIANGIRRYVLEAAEPFIVTCNHGGPEFRGQSLREPMSTITASRDARGLIVPYMVPRHGERKGQAPRCRPVGAPLPTVTGTANGASLVAAVLSQYHTGKSPGDSRCVDPDEPLRVIDTQNRHALVAAFLAKHYGGVVGQGLAEPTGTITGKDHHALVTSHAIKLRGTCRDGQDLRGPAPTLTAGGNHVGQVAALLAPYYGNGSGRTGRDLREPMPTITARDRLQLVTVHIAGEPYVIVDIGMRMLTPRELYRAQGFPDDYVIDPVVEGRRLSKAAQVRMCGNSVSPPNAAALVAANCPDLIAGREVGAA